MNDNPTAKSPFANPWIQLTIGVICMACVANLQYGWTWFVDPINAKYHWGRAAIQATFTVFVAIETWLIPVEGYLVDRFGPRYVVLGGAVLVAAAWVLNSVAALFARLFLGAALPVSPIKSMIDASGYEQTFMHFGLIQGGIVFVMAWLLLTPPPQLAGAVVKKNQTAHSYTPMQVLGMPVFYVLYVMFFLIACGGLTMAASIASIAKDLKIDKVPVDLFGYVLPAAVFAVQLNRIFDGVGRPFFGWLSDRIGREYTMTLAFLIGAGALFMLQQNGGGSAAMFVLVTAIYFGVYGEIFSLFPATAGDTFGSKFAASNAGMLYTAKGAGALMVPVAALISQSKGWGAVFAIAMAFNIVAALLALFVLRPMRAKHFAKSRVDYPQSAASTGPQTTSRC